jgi:hypothetical protein
MPITREIHLKSDSEQPMFAAIELGEVVREIASVEIQKKEANEEWNAQLKILKMRMFKLAADMKAQEKPADGIGTRS